MSHSGAPSQPADEPHPPHAHGGSKGQGQHAHHAQHGHHAPDWRRLHLWQIQPLRDAMILLAIFGLIYLGKVLSLVTVPILLALALAYLFEPLVRKVTARGLVSRPGAALGIILLAGLLIVVPTIVGAGFAVLQGASYAQRVSGNVQQLITVVQRPEDQRARANLPQGWQRLAEKIIDLRQRAERARAAQAAGEAGTTEPRQGEPRDAAAPGAGASPGGEAGAGSGVPPAPPAPLSSDQTNALQLYNAVDWSLQWIRNNAQLIGRTAISTGADALGAALRGLVSLGVVAFGAFLTAFFFYFFCTGYGRVLAFWEGLIPERKKGRVVDLLSQMDVVISGFIRGRLIICAILIVYYTLGYWLIGLNAWLLLGPIVGALTLIPYVAGVGVPVAILLMWLEPPETAWQSAWWWMTFAPALVTLGHQMLDDYILTPRIQGDATGMDIPTILFASIAAGVLAGFYGVLLAIPVAACIKILLREVVWPRVKAWAEGKARDPLPISRG